MSECTEMSWAKCDGCEFCVEVTTYSSDAVLFMCRITGKILQLRDCIKRQEGSNDGR